MGGGLMQLVAYGAQDVYLTGNPQITFFKVVYRRHTNFSVECIEQTFNGTADFGRTVTCNISRNGDLVTKMYLKVELEATTDENKSAYSLCHNLGRVLVESAKVEIGGSKIDEHYGDWLNVWGELSRNSSLDAGTNKMLGNTPELRKYTKTKGRYTMYVPMEFWFCRNNGLALPLIALQYHDVRITYKFRDAAECVSMKAGASRNDIKFKDAVLLIDYIYLDSEERKRFAQASHEYLIEQLQFTGEESVNTANEKFRLNFNHPCKALYWSLKLGNYTTGKSSVALADSGEIDVERFAKVIYMATRRDENVGGAGVYGGAAGAYIYTLNSGNANNEISNPTASTVGVDATKNDISKAVDDIRKKITAQFVFVDGTNAAAPLSLDNVVIISHTLDAADLSTAFDTLKSGVTSAEAKGLLDDHARTLRLHTNHGLYVDGTENPVQSAKLQLNGHDRFSERDGHYFNYVQPYQHFSNTPGDGNNVYSFALNPEEHQPSGSCNMSRIDNATLSLKLGERGADKAGSFADDYLVDDTVCSIYTVNYNVLRVMSGMGGLAYSN
jgi:hypothetical protein